MFATRPMLTAATIVATFDKVGATIPAPVRSAYETAEKVSREAKRLGQSGPDLTVAVYNALAEGRDPATDEAVQVALAAQSLGGEVVVRKVEADAGERLVNVMADQADAIVKAWRKPFDAAARDLTSAHSILGDIELTDTGAVVRRGAAATDAWANANKADATIAEIITGWATLARLIRATDDAKRTALRITQPTPTQWTEHKLTGRSLSAWEAVRLGLELHLPTTSEYRAALSELQAADEARSNATTVRQPSGVSVYQARV